VKGEKKKEYGKNGIAKHQKQKHRSIGHLQGGHVTGTRSLAGVGEFGKSQVKDEGGQRIRYIGRGRLCHTGFLKMERGEEVEKAREKKETGLQRITGLSEEIEKPAGNFGAAVAGRSLRWVFAISLLDKGG